MVAAIQSVMSGQLSICKAAVEFNVPRSSLGDHIHGRVVYGKKNSPDTLLIPADEAKLAAYLIDVSKQGYGKSKEIIIFMATQIAIKRGKNVKGRCLSDKWWQNFLKHHPQVSIRCTQDFSLVRTFLTRSTIETFYKQLFETITENDLDHCFLNHTLFSTATKVVSSLTPSTRLSLLQEARNMYREFPMVSTKRSPYWRVHRQLAIAFRQCSSSKV